MHTSVRVGVSWHMVNSWKASQKLSDHVLACSDLFWPFHPEPQIQNPNPEPQSRTLEPEPQSRTLATNKNPSNLQTRTPATFPLEPSLISPHDDLIISNNKQNTTTSKQAIFHIPNSPLVVRSPTHLTNPPSRLPLRKPSYPPSIQ